MNVSFLQPSIRVVKTSWLDQIPRVELNKIVLVNYLATVLN